MDNLPHIVIGNGVAARVLAYYLTQVCSDIPVIRISKDSAFPSCSQKTTSTVCLRGTKKDISPLGDLIVDAYDEFKSFYKKFSPKGVTPALTFQLWKTDDINHSKLDKRYFGISNKYNKFPSSDLTFIKNFRCIEQQSYIITPNLYLDWLNGDKIQVIDEVVKEIINEKNYIKVITDNQIIIGSKCFICCGIYNDYFFKHIVDDKLKQKLSRSRPVAGTYGEITIDQINNKSLVLKESFSISISGANIIYRHDEKKILIGATSENNSNILVPNRELFRPIYMEAKKALNQICELPQFEEVKLLTGVREKGQRRQPFWGMISENIFMISGLYKNGFSLANLAAKEICKDL